MEPPCPDCGPDHVRQTGYGTLVCTRCGQENFTWILSAQSSYSPYCVPLHSQATYTRLKRFRKYLQRASMQQSASTIPADTWDYLLAGAPYSRADIEPAVAELIPSVEIVDSVWRDWEKVGVQHLIADNACHAGLVLGAASENWRDLDLAELGVSVRLNDEPMLTGRGGNALGHPFNALAWLANDLISMGRHLKAGDIVSTGVLTGLIYAQAGDHIRADYGRFGSIELNFTDN